MSPFDHDEYKRWLSQARHTFVSAQGDVRDTDYAWAAFKAQQAAEYAVKALLRGLGRPAFGHALQRLINELGEGIPEEIRNAGRLLDRHYIPTRYPDAYPEGSPHEYYDADAAEEALGAAERIITWVEGASRGA